MKKNFITFICLLFVSFLYSQVSSEDISKARQLVKESARKNSSRNWLSLSSGFSHNYIYVYQGNTFPTKNRMLTSDFNYSYRHFYDLDSNNYLSYDVGVFFVNKKNEYNTGLILKTTSLSLSGRILYNYRFGRLSINTGIGMGLISLQRTKENYMGLNRELMYDETFVGRRSEYFGIIGLNLKINKNNEIGIRAYYELLKNKELTIFRNFSYQRILIFQLKINHRLV